MNIIPEKTKDGSYTIYVPDMDEHYHSTNGAVQEAEHIYINAGLNYLNLKKVKILEMGFGTGLNAILTLKFAINKDLKINYTAIEKYPLQNNFLEKLKFESILTPELHKYFTALHTSSWGKQNSINDNFSLTKINKDLKAFTPKQNYNLIYFDAFAPNKQPNLWTIEIFEKLFNSLENSGIFVTYSAKGTVRRALESVGFNVERIPGPPGKRQIIRAIKPNSQ